MVAWGSFHPALYGDTELVSLPEQVLVDLDKHRRQVVQDLPGDMPVSSGYLGPGNQAVITNQARGWL
jgi:hypothetical protein